MAVERAPRKDAVRNRALLVEAAATAFREEGLDVSVNAIAARAGVNVATLYRHFPSKEALVAAVLELVLEPLVAARDRALAAPPGTPVLGVFFRAAAAMQSEHRGLVDAIARMGEVRARLREPSVAIARPLVERAHDEGELRPGFGAIDVLVALKMVSAVAAMPTAVDVDRYVDVVVRGLRPG